MWKLWAPKKKEFVRNQNPLRNSLIPVLQHDRADLRLIAAAAGVISADAELNLWVAGRKAREEFGEQEFLDLLERYEHQHSRCLAAIAEFEASGSADKLNEELLDIAKRFRSEINNQSVR